MKHILVNNIIIFLFIFLNSFTNSITSIKKNKTFKTIVNPKPKNTSIHNPTKMKTIKKTFKTKKIFQETSNDIVFNKKFIGASIVKITNGKMVASSNIILTNIDGVHLLKMFANHTNNSIGSITGVNPIMDKFKINGETYKIRKINKTDRPPAVNKMIYAHYEGPVIILI